MQWILIFVMTGKLCRTSYIYTVSIFWGALFVLLSNVLEPYYKSISFHENITVIDHRIMMIGYFLNERNMWCALVVTLGVRICKIKISSSFYFISEIPQPSISGRNCAF